MKEFKDEDLERHPAVHHLLVRHVFETYLPKTEYDAGCSGVGTLQTSIHDLERSVGAHTRSLDSHTTTMTNLWRDLTNGLARKQDKQGGGGGRNGRRNGQGGGDGSTGQDE